MRSISIDTLQDTFSKVVLDTLNSNLISNTQPHDKLHVVLVNSLWENPATYFSLITAIIAICAIWLPLRRAKKKEDRRLKSIEEYLYEILRELTKHISRKAIKLAELSAHVKSYNADTFNFAESSTIHVRKFNDISSLDVYEILISRRKLNKSEQRRHFMNLIDSIDFFEKQNNIDKENFAAFIDDFRRYGRQFRIHGDEITDLFNTYIYQNTQDQISPQDDKVLLEIQKVLETMSRSDPGSIHRDETMTLLNQLKNICLENQSDPRVHKFIPCIRASIDALDNLTHLMVTYSTVIDSAKTDLMNWNKKLEEAIEFFFNKKLS